MKGSQIGLASLYKKRYQRARSPSPPRADTARSRKEGPHPDSAATASTPSFPPPDLGGGTNSLLVGPPVGSVLGEEPHGTESPWPQGRSPPCSLSSPTPVQVPDGPPDPLPHCHLVPGDPGKPLVPGKPCNPPMPRRPGRPVEDPRGYSMAEQRETLNIIRRSFLL